MDALLIMLKNVIVFVLLAVPGFLLVKTKLLGQAESGSLSKLLTYVGLPFMVFSSTLNILFTKEIAISAIIIALIGIAFTFASVLITALLTRGEEGKRKGMLRFAMCMANNGFLGIPLAKAVFGDSPETTYLIVLNIVTNLMLFTVGIYLVSGDKKTVSLKKVAFNPVLIAFVLGIAINLTGFADRLPEVRTYAAHFGGIVTALSMTVLGMKLAGIRFTSLFTKWRMYYAAAIRLVAFPVIGTGLLIALSFFLPVSAAMIMGFFVAFAMPTAGLATTFADNYGGDTENAVIYTLGSTVLSVATIPLLYGLLNLILA